MRPRDWLLIPLTFAVGVAGLIWGGRNAYVSLHNRSPLQLTCAQYEAHPPDMQWVRLTDCVPDTNRIGVETSTREGVTMPEVTAVYIPLRSPSSTAPAKVVLAIDHGPLLALGDEHSTKAQQATIDLFSRPIPGLIELGVDRSKRDRKRLNDLNLNVEADFAVLAYDDEPRPIPLALGALGAGLGAVALLVRRFRRRKPRVDLARATLVNE